MFDELESKIADTQLLIASSCIDLPPFSQLGNLAKAVRDKCTHAYLMGQPVGKYMFQQFLDGIGVGRWQTFYEDATRFSLTSATERFHEASKLVQTYLKVESTLSFLPEELEIVKQITDTVDNSGGTLPSAHHRNASTTSVCTTSSISDIPATLFHPLIAKLVSKLEQLHIPSFLNSSQFEKFIQYKQYCHKKVDINSFTSFRILGRGAFGAVRAVVKSDTQRMFAMKVMSKAAIKRKNDFKVVLNERMALITTDQGTNTTQERVLALKYAFQDDRNFYLVIPYCSGGDLGFHLKSCQKFDENRARFYLAEVLLGLEILHKASFIYRDLKPENLLLTAQGHCVISDLGLARVMRKDRPITNACGTPGYWAVEVMQRKPQNETADFWSLGVLLYKFLSGHLPDSVVNNEANEFNPFSRKPLDEDIAQRAGSVPIVNIYFPDYFSEAAVNLIQQLLVVNPSNRLGSNGSQEIRDHEFFKSFSWSKLISGKMPVPFIPASDEVNAESTTFRDTEEDAGQLWTDSEMKLFEDFYYSSEKSSQREIVESLTDNRQALPENHNDTSCCTVS